jgi:hypothetical protein
MSVDLTVILQNRPGELARLGETLSGAEINIEGLCAAASEGEGEVHVLVEDAAAARRALEGASIPVSGERDVLMVEFPDRPGALGKAARTLADAGVNIDFAYYASSVAKHVFGIDDLTKAQRALSG